MPPAGMAVSIQFWNSLTGSRFGGARHSVRAAQWVEQPVNSVASSAK